MCNVFLNSNSSSARKRGLPLLAKRGSCRLAFVCCVLYCLDFRTVSLINCGKNYGGDGGGTAMKPVLPLVLFVPDCAGFWALHHGGAANGGE